MMLTSGKRQLIWLVMLCSAAILMITMGTRQSVGLFIEPIEKSTGLSIVSISLALAVGQFVWGLVQPIFGAIADRKGSIYVLLLGAFLIAAGLALTPLATTKWSLMITLGVLSAAGAGAASISILIGVATPQLPPERRAFAAGFINAGGSFGQFLFAPLAQLIIGAFGWVAAMLTMAATALLTIPLAVSVCRGTSLTKSTVSSQASGDLWLQVRRAMRNVSYLCLHAGFFTCGFHIAFLVTHLPREVSLWGHSAHVSASWLTSLAYLASRGASFPERWDQGI